VLIGSWIVCVSTAPNQELSHLTEDRAPSRPINSAAYLCIDPTLLRRCGNECLLEGLEGYERIFIEVERSLFGKKTCQRPGYMGEILDEPPIKASVP
jgi:hypothetical protein